MDTNYKSYSQPIKIFYSDVIDQQGRTLDNSTFSYYDKNNNLIAVSEKPGGIYGFTPFENFYNNINGIINNGKLNINFSFYLNPRNIQNVKKIKIHNILATFTTSSGSAFNMTFDCFTSEVMFQDSESGSIEYQEYIEGNLPTRVTCNLQRLSGPNPSQLKNGIDNLAYITNPFIGFTITFYYY